MEHVPTGLGRGVVARHILSGQKLHLHNKRAKALSYKGCGFMFFSEFLGKYFIHKVWGKGRQSEPPDIGPLTFASSFTSQVKETALYAISSMFPMVLKLSL